MNINLETVQTEGKFLVVKYYANALYTGGDKENGNPYYGDIYLSRADVLKDHPEAEVLEGYGVHDAETSFALDDTEDWYDTVQKALEYIENE